ncbi:hypothetical protein [Halomonas sp. PR-M31]|uniref:hypothetical protein n=1 Tax=Halomonas sp. PR-M31 TaxID=1471202 RepID=UPI000651BE4B|nr:hypothetical protein [Halomonas sp. PR-M31]
MALVPRSIVQLLQFEEVARLLAGLDPGTPPKMLTDEAARLREWQRAIVYAVIDGSLCPTGGRAWIYEPATSTETPLAFYDPDVHQVHGQFLRKDVATWLKSVGVSDADIPELLKPPPVAPGDARDDLRVLEGLGLLIEALAQHHPNLYGVRAGKPNRLRIGSIMLGVVEGYARPTDPKTDPVNLYGLAKTSVDDLLKDAIGAWERRKGN